MSTYYNLIHFLEEHMLSCPSRKYLHLDCPGCGLQRSLLSLLKGEFLASLHLYPATIPVLILLSFSLLHVKYKFSAGAEIIKYLMILTATVIGISYIYKIIGGKITA